MKQRHRFSLLPLLFAASLGFAVESALPPEAAMPNFPLDSNGKPIIPPGPRPKAKLANAIPIALAIEAAQTAVTACLPEHAGVVFLDATGSAKLYYLDDGTPGPLASPAYKKANTALAFQLSSSAVGKLVVSDKSAADKLAQGGSNYLPWAGGLPIYAKGKLIGAIGIGGAKSSEDDERCALFAMSKIQSRLDQMTLLEP